MTTRIGVTLVALVVLTSSCVRIPDESVALTRLAEAEVLATELVEATVGPERMAPWEHTVDVEGCPLICANCHAADSIMYLRGEFDRDEVMEAFALAGEAKGGVVGDVRLIGETYSRLITLTGPSRDRHVVLIAWDDGAVRVLVGTGSPSCYRVRE